MHPGSTIRGYVKRNRTSTEKQLTPEAQRERERERERERRKD